MSPRFWKLLVLSYAVKTLLVGLAWLMVPDLPARAANKARQTWSAVVGGTSHSPSQPTR
jgi:hypothetical protein